MRPRFLFLLLLPIFAWAQPAPWPTLMAAPELQLSRQDLVVYDHFLQIYKVASKGYASDYLLDKGLKESGKSPRLAMFHEWLTDLKRYPTLPHEELMQTCLELRGRLKTTFGMSRRLLIQRLVYCRQIALQQMVPLALAQKGLTPQNIAFLKAFMPHLLYGRSSEDFLWMLKRVVDAEEVKSLLSSLVTEHVVQKKKPLPRDMLPLLVITPDLTRHVQNYGLDLEATRQVFYAEFSRMVENSYRAVDEKKKDKVVDLAGQMHHWLKLNLARLPKDLTLGRYSDLGKNLWRNGYEDQALAAFETVIASGNVEQREDATFYRWWMWASRDKWKEAMEWAKKKKLLENFDKLADSRLKYWLAYGEWKTKSADAQKLWEKVIDQHPLSFYAIMSSKALQAFYPSSAKTDFYRQATQPSAPELKLSEVDPSMIEAWKRLRAWARLDAKPFLNSELKGFEKNFIPGLVSRAPKERQPFLESDARLISAALVGAEGNYLESFRAVYAALDARKVRFNRFLLEILYPRPYFADLQKAMKGALLDPLVLLSLIRQESVFNPEARSRVGARGLMQLMPTTAKRMQRSVRERQLSTPITNLTLGAKYFQQLHKRYEGNLVYVLAAYNAGEARVERWKGLYFVSEEMLPNVESIPFLETRNYVKLIFRNLFFYKTLEAATGSRDPATFNQIYDVELGFKR